MNVNQIDVDINKIEDYKFPINEPFILKVNYNDVDYRFFINFRENSSNLLCFGSGAQLRNKKQVLVN